MNLEEIEKYYEQNKEIVDYINKTYNSENTIVIIDMLHDKHKVIKEFFDPIRLFMSFCDQYQGFSGQLPLVIFNLNPEFRIFANLDRKVISLNSGVISILQSIFHSIMSNPRVFPEIGNSSLEQLSEGKIEYIPSFSWQLDLDKRTPVCEERKIYANFLVDTAINFIFAHEISHIRRNHIVKVSSQAVLSEKDNYERYSDREKVEIDADLTACSLISTYLNYAKTNFNSNHNYKTIFESEEKIIKSLLFSSSILMFLLMKDWSWKSSSKRNYPPPSAREILLLTQLGVSIEHIFGLPRMTVEKYLSETLEISNMAITEISENVIFEIRKKQFTDFASELRNYISEIYSMREALEQELGDENFYRNVL